MTLPNSREVKGSQGETEHLQVRTASSFSNRDLFTPAVTHGYTPLLFPEDSFRSARTQEKPSSSSSDSGISWWSHDSVNTMIHESLYS